MPPRRLTAITASVLLIIASSGCGSSQDQFRASVGRMRAAIQAYNVANHGSLKATGVACRQAWSDMDSARSGFSKSPADHQKAAAALRSAYIDARAGFRACWSAATRMDYPGMVAASDQLAAANGELRRATSLDR